MEENLGHRLIQRSGDDEQYTTSNGVKILLPYIEHLRDKIIWCPFDTENSQFVKVLSKEGYKVVYSHIWDGKDFFAYEPKKWDVILSNPPYKDKRLYIERCITLSKPWCLLLPLQTLADQTFYNILKSVQDLQMFVPKGRLRFDTFEMPAGNRPGPTFKAVYFAYNFFQTKENMIFEQPLNGLYLSQEKDSIKEWQDFVKAQPNYSHDSSSLYIDNIPGQMVLDI